MFSKDELLGLGLRWASFSLQLLAVALKIQITSACASFAVPVAVSHHS